MAEVLITLAIISVVAAMTIPTLIQSYQEKVTVTRLKKVYSFMSQAYLMAEQEYGDPRGWDLRGFVDPQGALNFYEHLAPYLKIMKNCGNGPGCFTGSPIHDTSSVYAKFTLSDGTDVFLAAHSADCSQPFGNFTTCGSFYVDITGAAPPNAYGRDIFGFAVTKDKIVPYGTQNDTFRPFLGCLNSTKTEGHNCTAWVLYNENMDYLHCKDLSWGGKTKCD